MNKDTHILELLYESISGIKQVPLSFDDFFEMVSNDPEFTLFADDYEKNEGNLNHWRDRNITGFFKGNNLIGYLITGRDFFIKNSLHIFTIEIKQSERSGGIGSKILQQFIDSNKGETITLQAHEPSLISYYERFGFELQQPNDGGNLMVRNVNS